jgi:hypothetical protein
MITVERAVAYAGPFIYLAQVTEPNRRMRGALWYASVLAFRTIAQLREVRFTGNMVEFDFGTDVWRFAQTLSPDNQLKVHGNVAFLTKQYGQAKPFIPD